MIIFCDPTNDYIDKPIYTNTLVDFKKEYYKHNFENGRFIVAVYDLKDTTSYQIFNQRNPFNYPKGFTPPLFDGYGKETKKVSEKVKKEKENKNEVAELYDVVQAVNEMISNSNRNTSLLAGHLENMSKKLSKTSIHPIVVMPDQSEKTTQLKSKKTKESNVVELNA